MPRGDLDMDVPDNLELSPMVGKYTTEAWYWGRVGASDVEDGGISIVENGAERLHGIESGEGEKALAISSRFSNSARWNRVSLLLSNEKR